jgi:hypothetical protein
MKFDLCFRTIVSPLLQIVYSFIHITNKSIAYYIVRDYPGAIMQYDARML